LLPVPKSVGGRLLAGTTVVAGKSVVKPEPQKMVAGLRNAFFRTAGLQFLVVVASFQVQRVRPAILPSTLWVAATVGLSLCIFALGWGEIWRWGVRRGICHSLRRTGYLLRNRTALDGLGKIDVCCFDKTGILTTRSMSVTGVLSPGFGEFSGEQQALQKSLLFRRIVEGCAFCHQPRNVQATEKQPLEDAILDFARRQAPESLQSTDYKERVVMVPFAPEKRFSVSKGKICGEIRSWMKGAPETVLQQCGSYSLADGREISITADFLLETARMEKEQFFRGNTVIALAVNSKRESFTELTGYCFLGLLVLENPLRKEAGDVVRILAKQKVRSLILTGDTPTAAIFTGRKLEIVGTEDTFLSGSMIKKMSLGDIAEQSRYVSLFCRLTPSQKGLVVEALKRQGREVLMIGDGANDAIALKLANISLSLQEDSSMLARKNSDILIRNDLQAIPYLLAVGRQYRLWNRWMPRLHGVALINIVGLCFWQLWLGAADPTLSFRYGVACFCAGIVVFAEIVFYYWLARKITTRDFGGMI
jgi:magnesium-transporting ATPase (P-type)